MFAYRPYMVEISFKNEGTVYGTESYRIMARNEDEAERKALINASASVYDDPRIPDRKIVVASVDEADDENDQEAA